MYVPGGKQPVTSFHYYPPACICRTHGTPLVPTPTSPTLQPMKTLLCICLLDSLAGAAPPLLQHGFSNDALPATSFVGVNLGLRFALR